MTDTSIRSFVTRQFHAGQQLDPANGTPALPIYFTTSLVSQDTQYVNDAVKGA